MKEDHLCLLKANNREQELQFLNLAAAFFWPNFYLDGVTAVGVTGIHFIVPWIGFHFCIIQLTNRTKRLKICPASMLLDTGRYFSHLE